MWEREQLIAEHGLSLLLSIERGGRSASLIYDAGLGCESAIHNMDVLQVLLPDLRAVVIRCPGDAVRYPPRGLARAQGRLPDGCRVAPPTTEPPRPRPRGDRVDRKAPAESLDRWHGA